MDLCHQDRRQTPRLPVRIPIFIRLGANSEESFEAVVLDISEGGVFVHGTAPIAIGEKVRIEFRFTALDMEMLPLRHHRSVYKNAPPATVQATAVVCWARGTAITGFGLKFVNLQPDEKEYVFKLVTMFG